MKRTFLISAALAGLASIASAASGRSDSPYVFPTYVVTAPREIPAEQHVREHLDAFREQARQAPVVVPGPATLKTQPAIAGHVADLSRKVTSKA